MLPQESEGKQQHSHIDAINFAYAPTNKRKSHEHYLYGHRI